MSILATHAILPVFKAEAAVYQRVPVPQNSCTLRTTAKFSDAFRSQSRVRRNLIKSFSLAFNEIGHGVRHRQNGATLRDRSGGFRGKVKKLWVPVYLDAPFVAQSASASVFVAGRSLSLCFCAKLLALSSEVMHVLY